MPPTERSRASPHPQKQLKLLPRRQISWAEFKKSIFTCEAISQDVNEIGTHFDRDLINIQNGNFTFIWSHRKLPDPTLIIRPHLHTAIVEGSTLFSFCPSSSSLKKKKGGFSMEE
ncbi:hypothetical protein CDAR_388831 [Caerostris darwini]|uniref:Uncharacterized protein n=1 Tax=Caerostris darwini TaxID=1538125 RepID=A0AAV4SAA7_9ARAC|nr:hypothetical protein CDAR_388831 [Caerostris darwini]